MQPALPCSQLSWTGSPPKTVRNNDNGWIEVESEVGRSTTFRIYLTRLATAPAIPPVESATVPGRGRGEVILLVEDEHAVREMSMMALGMQGYRVQTADSGPAALAVWAGHKAEIALLFTDVSMPGGMSGLQLARQLLQDKPDLRVIYTSGYSREIAGKELAIKGDANYLAKPYELEQLFHSVRTALDGKHSRHPFEAG